MTNPPPPPPPPGPQPYGQPPPPPAPAQPSPQAYGQQPPPPPPPPAPGHPPVAPPGFPVAPAKPPRPRIPIAAALLVVGAVLVLAGCLLPWVTGGDETLNGFDNFYCDQEFDCIGTKDSFLPREVVEDDSVNSFEPAAVLSIIGIVVMLAFAITFFAAGRVFAVAIISTVLTGLGVLIAFLYIAIAASAADWAGGEIGIGVFVHFLGAIVAVAGSVVALAKRRRPVAYA